MNAKTARKLTDEARKAIDECVAKERADKEKAHRALIEKECDKLLLRIDKERNAQIQKGLDYVLLELADTPTSQEAAAIVTKALMKDDYRVVLSQERDRCDPDDYPITYLRLEVSW